MYKNNRLLHNTSTINIRWVFFKDTIRGKKQTIARPLDLPEEDLLELIQRAIKEKLFSKSFVDGLKEILNK